MMSGSLRRLLSACLIAWLAVLPAQGGGFPEEDWDPHLLRMLSDGPVLIPADMEVGLLPPPGPEVTLREIDAMRDLARLREDPKTDLLIHLENHPDMDLIFYFWLHGLIPEEIAGALRPWLEVTHHDARWVVLREKARFMRARPDALAPDLAPVIDRPPHPAYPSGHSTESHFIALMIGAILPGCRERALALAADIALRREIAGVHYASDSRAGHLLALRLSDAMIGMPALQELELAARQAAATLPLACGQR